jgi:hypothetical protein
LRRSTTDWTWLSPLRSVARSIVAFIIVPRPASRIYRGQLGWFLAKKKGPRQAPGPFLVHIGGSFRWKTAQHPDQKRKPTPATT